MFSLILVACGSGDTEKAREAGEGQPYRVVCTIGMITDLVRVIAGEHAKVEGLIGEGVDPHLYNPTRRDVVRLSEADVVFYNGLLLEGRMTDILQRIAQSGKPVRAVTELILEESDYLLADGDNPGKTDPHVWMDVSAWMRAVPIIVESLSNYDPDNASTYVANGESYLEQLQALHAYAQRVMATIPESQRVLVTAHDAFQYMGRAYSIEVRGIQGVSTESEAGVRDLEDLIRFIVKQKIPSVFVETSVADKNVRALQEGARAKGHAVVIGGSLFSDAMGESGTYEGTYIGMIDHNITTIVNALGGQAEGFREREQ